MAQDRLPEEILARVHNLFLMKDLKWMIDIQNGGI